MKVFLQQNFPYDSLFNQLSIRLCSYIARLYLHEHKKQFPLINELLRLVFNFVHIFALTQQLISIIINKNRKNINIKQKIFFFIKPPA